MNTFQKSSIGYSFGFMLLAFGWLPFIVATAFADQRPNVILIVCDDLNNYVEGYGGHPQAKTPNMARLSRSGVLFSNAHCTIPICGPSRASFFTGIYPHNSGCYGFTKWDGYEVLKNSRTMMDHFRANGYRTMGTGKMMHHLVRKEWGQYENPADYGPFAHDGNEKVAHPDVPAPYREIGAIDGSFGPLVNLGRRSFPDGKSYHWQTGGWSKQRKLNVETQDNRDATADEFNGKWAVETLEQLASETDGKPFFMGVGFIRPHTPLIVPQRFFDMFPLESIELPVIKANDVEDTFSHTVRGNPADLEEPGAARTNDMGSRLYDNLIASYDSREEALKRFIQAYLASVASVDELIGEILDVVEQSSLADNTIIILTSDHGWGMGEKDYLYKNSLWQESTQVPLIIRAPGIGKVNVQTDHPVSLVDLFPTLIDLCDLKGETKKNDKGADLDGYSLKPFLVDSKTTDWEGPDAALTALYKWRMKYDPSAESYSLRFKDWRYIQYDNGKEELYQTDEDPHEWNNLALDTAYASRLADFRAQMKARIPKPGTTIPPQPPWKPKVTAPETKAADANAWKDQYFKKHPKADTNGDGVLTWPEYKAYRAEFDPVPKKK